MPTITPASSIDLATWTAGQSLERARSDGLSGAANGIDRSARPDSRTKDVGQQFEAMYLRQMLEEFMPKDSEALFGKGTSGTVWRSMLVDSLATTLSKAGTMGLAQMVIGPETSEPEGK